MDTPHSPKLQCYWSLTIRLFCVIYPGHMGKSYSSAEMQSVYSATSAAGPTSLWYVVENFSFHVIVRMLLFFGVPYIFRKDLISKHRWAVYGNSSFMCMVFLSMKFTSERKITQSEYSLLNITFTRSLSYLGTIVVMIVSIPF